MTKSNKSVSRDLLSLEGGGGPISPFLISPGDGEAGSRSGGSSGGGAFPFVAPSSRQLGHAPLPMPAGLLSADDDASATAAAASSNGAAATSAPPSRLKTFSMPPSSLLSRVQAFLPALAQANAKLEQDIATHGPEAFDIENISTRSSGQSNANTAGQHIVMDLSVGVLELQKDAPELDELGPAIIIPGVSDPSKLARTAADSDSDDEEGGAGASGGGGGSSSSSAGSKAARKKRKYRARAKLKQSAAGAAAAASGSGDGDANGETPPLPAPAKGSLIQVMEE